MWNKDQQFCAHCLINVFHQDIMFTSNTHKILDFYLSNLLVINIINNCETKKPRKLCVFPNKHNVSPRHCVYSEIHNILCFYVSHLLIINIINIYETKNRECFLYFWVNIVFHKEGSGATIKMIKQLHMNNKSVKL